MRTSASTKESKNSLSTWFYASLNSHKFSGIFSFIPNYLLQSLRDLPKSFLNYSGSSTNYDDPNWWNAFFNYSLDIFIEEYPELSTEQVAERLAQMQTLIGPKRLSLLVYQEALINVCEELSDERLTIEVNHQFALLRSRLIQDETFTLHCFNDDFNTISRNILLPDDYPIIQNCLFSYADWFSTPAYQTLLNRINEKVLDYLREEYAEENPENKFIYRSLKKDWKALLNTCLYKHYQNQEKPLSALEKDAQYEETHDNTFGFWEYMTLFLMGSSLVTSNGVFQCGLNRFLTAMTASNNPFQNNSLAIFTTTALFLPNFIPAISAQSLYDRTAFPRDSTVSETPITEITEEKQTDPFCLTLINGQLAVFIAINDKVYFEVFARDATLVHPLTLVFNSTGVQSLSIQPAAAHPNGGFGLTFQEETENEVIVRYFQYDQTYNPIINTVVLLRPGYSFKNPEPILTIQRTGYQETPLTGIFCKQLNANTESSELSIWLAYNKSISFCTSLMLRENYKDRLRYSLVSTTSKDLYRINFFYPSSTDSNSDLIDIYTFICEAFYNCKVYNTFKLNKSPCKNPLFFAKNLSDGTAIAVAWQCDSMVIKLVIISIFGQILTDEIILTGNFSANLVEVPPSITALSDNRFVISQPIYTESTLSYTDIALQLLQYQNGKVTVLNETLANTNTHFVEGSSSSTTLGFSQFVLVFSSVIKKMPTEYGTFLQKIDSGFNKLPFNQESIEPTPGSSCNVSGSCGFGIKVNVHSKGEQISPVLALLNYRILLMIWQSQYYQFSDGSSSLAAVLVDAESGQLLKTEFPLLPNSATGDKTISDQPIARLHDRGFVMVYQDWDGIIAMDSSFRMEQLCGWETITSKPMIALFDDQFNQTDSQLLKTGSESYIALRNIIALSSNDGKNIVFAMEAYKYLQIDQPNILVTPHVYNDTNRSLDAISLEPIIISRATSKNCLHNLEGTISLVNIENDFLIGWTELGKHGSEIHLARLGFDGKRVLINGNESIKLTEDTSCSRQSFQPCYFRFTPFVNNKIICTFIESDGYFNWISLILLNSNGLPFTDKILVSDKVTSLLSKPNAAIVDSEVIAIFWEGINPKDLSDTALNRRLVNVVTGERMPDTDDYGLVSDFTWSQQGSPSLVSFLNLNKEWITPCSYMSRTQDGDGGGVFLTTYKGKEKIDYLKLPSTTGTTGTSATTGSTGTTATTGTSGTTATTDTTGTTATTDTTGTTATTDTTGTTATTDTTGTTATTDTTGTTATTGTTGTSGTTGTTATTGTSGTTGTTDTTETTVTPITTGVNTTSDHNSRLSNGEIAGITIAGAIFSLIFMCIAGFIYRYLKRNQRDSTDEESLIPGKDENEEADGVGFTENDWPLEKGNNSELSSLDDASERSGKFGRYLFWGCCKEDDEPDSKQRTLVDKDPDSGQQMDDNVSQSLLPNDENTFRGILQTTTTTVTTQPELPNTRSTKTVKEFYQEEKNKPYGRSVQDEKLDHTLEYIAISHIEWIDEFKNNYKTFYDSCKEEQEKKKEMESITYILQQVITDDPIKPRMERKVALRFSSDDGWIVEKIVTNQKRYERERSILQKCHDCDYIIKLKDYSDAENKLILPYYPKTLYQEIQARKSIGSMETHNIAKIMLNIFYAIKYLHGKGILYTDLHTKNILLINHYFAVLADFTHSRMSDDPPISEINKNSRQPTWQAPEISKFEKIDEKVDVHGIGYIFSCLILNKESLKKSEAVLNAQGILENLPKKYSNFGCNIYRALDPDKNNRPTMQFLRKEIKELKNINEASVT